MREESSEEKNVLKEVASVDDIIHTPVRLAIMIFLLPKEKALFTEVQKVLDLTAGNLSSHIKRLEEHGLIEVQKAFIKAKPTTILYLTEKGVNSIQKYANLMTTVLTTILEEKKEG
ncbi:transcriptional regulator [Candidatus Pacearchaeota archaeon]|nr:MAG: transcriptional regulator [Candidatus Pacearchaeota archaeon]